jgi:predicted enzyme related to lactoylglutathione lyase
MTNPHGTPIWYELVTPDPDASKTFYDAVLPWSVGEKPEGAMDYRMIDTGEGGLVGGVMRLSDEMKAGGAKPRWLFYIGVDDVDATVENIRAGGGQVHMGPFDLPGVGRMAFVADPQGVPFYVMRGASPESSTAWGRMDMGKCNWNELTTSDQAGANAFYADVFGWSYPDKMPMGDMGDYWFVDAAGQTIGATMTAQAGTPTGWQFYFRAPDIDAAKATVEASGGTVHAGPMEVPGGDWIIVASDPHGAMFGVVSPAKQEA